MDPTEIEMWSDPISIWRLIEDRRAFYQKSILAEAKVEALRTTIQRLELEKQMLRRRMGYEQTA